MNELPPEVLIQCFNGISLNDVQYLARVCSYWKECIDSHFTYITWTYPVIKSPESIYRFGKRATGKTSNAWEIYKDNKYTWPHVIYANHTTTATQLQQEFNKACSRAELTLFILDECDKKEQATLTFQLPNLRHYGISLYLIGQLETDFRPRTRNFCVTNFVLSKFVIGRRLQKYYNKISTKVDLSSQQ